MILSFLQGVWYQQKHVVFPQHEKHIEGGDDVMVDMVAGYCSLGLLLTICHTFSDLLHQFSSSFLSR